MVLNPHTPASSISEVMGLIDEVLVMTVNPGFGGQRYIASVEPKIAAVRQMIDGSGRDIDLEVDGGINEATAAAAVRAGANVLVAGSAVFGHASGPASAIEALTRSSQPQEAERIDHERGHNRRVAERGRGPSGP